MIQMTCQTFSVELFDLRCGSPAACVCDPWPDQLLQYGMRVSIAKVQYSIRYAVHFFRQCTAVLCPVHVAYACTYASVHALRVSPFAY